MPTLKKGRAALKGVRAGLVVSGFSASGISAGIKKGRKKDLALILSTRPCTVAGLFTKNSVKAAPVLLSMERIKGARARGVLINSGNANACTGKRGLRDAEDCAAFVEKALGLERGGILVCSTGVIGVPLPVERIKKAVPRLVKGLSPQGFEEASEAIMTTDAFPKRVLLKAETEGGRITVAGIAKGAGMICPDMATMLAFLLTDVRISARLLKSALKRAVEGSFNRIVVDNDTSTNDTVLAFANGSGGVRISSRGPAFDTLLNLFEEVSKRLALMMVSDGEGATKVVEINVKGAATPSQAERAARAIATSFLVKTAFFGGDPNWGRIIAALGRAGVKMREDLTDISFDNVMVLKRGLPTGREGAAARVLKKKSLILTVDLNSGGAGFRLWTSDLGFDYVRLNSAYRT